MGGGCWTRRRLPVWSPGPLTHRRLFEGGDPDPGPRGVSTRIRESRSITLERPKSRHQGRTRGASEGGKGYRASTRIGLIYFRCIIVLTHEGDFGGSLSLELFFSILTLCSPLLMRVFRGHFLICVSQARGASRQGWVRVMYALLPQRASRS